MINSNTWKCGFVFDFIHVIQLQAVCFTAYLCWKYLEKYNYILLYNT